MALADLEDAAAANPQWGVAPNPYGETAATYRQQAAQAKALIDQRFWDSSSGRLGAVRDINGNLRDIGHVGLNLMAIFYDALLPQRKPIVMDWIAGTRTVAGDDAVGSQIYGWTFGPRTNTVDVSDWYIWPMYIWFGSNLTVPPGALWDQQVMNGGGWFWLSFYDLVSRIRIRGPDDAWSRLDQIRTWYAATQAAGGFRNYYQSNPGLLQGCGSAGNIGWLRIHRERLFLTTLSSLGIERHRPALEPQLPTPWTSRVLNACTSAALLQRQARRMYPDVTVETFRRPGSPASATLRTLPLAVGGFPVRCRADKDRQFRDRNVPSTTAAANTEGYVLASVAMPADGRVHIASVIFSWVRVGIDVRLSVSGTVTAAILSGVGLHLAREIWLALFGVSFRRPGASLLEAHTARRAPTSRHTRDTWCSSRRSRSRVPEAWEVIRTHQPPRHALLRRWSVSQHRRPLPELHRSAEFDFSQPPKRYVDGAVGSRGWWPPRLVSCFWAVLFVPALWSCAGAMVREVSAGSAAFFLVGLTPQVIFSFGTFNNDAAVISLSTLAFALVLESNRRRSDSLLLLAAGFCGLALWAKLTAAFLFFPLMVVATRWPRRRIAAVTGAAWLAMLSALLFYQATRGIPLGHAVPPSWGGGGGSPGALITEPGWLVTLWLGTWAKLGWFNVHLPIPLYAWFLFPATALAAGVWAALRGRTVAGVACSPRLESSRYPVYDHTDWQPQGRLPATVRRALPPDRAIGSPAGGSPRRMVTSASLARLCLAGLRALHLAYAGT